MMRLRCLSMLVLSVLAPLRAQESGISGAQVLANIASNFSGIQDYTVSLDVAVDLDRLKVPQMKATMYFKQPDKTHFVAEGFALLPKEGLNFAAGNLRSRFNVRDVNREGRLVTVTLISKNDRTQLRKFFVTVDTTHWTVSHVTTSLFDGRHMSAVLEHQPVERHWLPSRMTVTFTADSTVADTLDPLIQLPSAQRSSQIPRKGTMTVRYTDYRLNTGLKDGLFETPKEEHAK